MLITNHHVIKDGKQITAKSENGAYFMVAGVLADNSTMDLAVLRLQGKNFPFLALGEGVNVETGTHIAVIGSPLGLEGSLSEGIVSAMRDDIGKDRLLQITAAISPGSSGSPVLQSDGKVIGVATATLVEGQSLNFAIPIEVGKALLIQAQAVARPVPLKDETADDDYGYFNDPDYKIKFRNLSDPIEKLKLGQLLASRYPHSAGAYLNLGQVYLELHFAGDAVNAFLKSIQIQSNLDLAWNFLCDAYRLSNKKIEAIDACRHAVLLNPDESLYWYSLGQAYEGVRKNEDALAAFQKAVERAPQYAETWSALGGAYRNLSRYADAVAACQKAIALSANSCEAWSCLGYSYGLANQYKESIAAFERAVALEPQNAEAWEGLAMYLGSAGKHDRASKAVKELEKLNPEMARQIYEMLILQKIGDSIK
jgi:tetratricopeptide (TPR) repeat protein